MMKKILIIDDDDLFRGMIKKLLEKAGYAVTEANDGQVGLKMMPELSPDLVITDILMPNMDGLETITALQKDDPNIKIIAISGGGRISSTCYLPLANTMGATRCFDKPFDNKEFLQAVKELLASP